MLKTKNQIIVVSCLLLILVSGIDYFLPYEITTFILYLIPITVISYQDKISKTYIYLFCTLAYIIWYLLDYISHPYSNIFFNYVNAITRATVFFLLSTIMNRLVIEKKQRQLISIQKIQLEEANKKMSAANNELNRFVGIAAHDIRNPVGNILSFSEILLETDINAEERQQFIELINLSAKNSLQILNDTLNISQIQSGTISLQKSVNDYIVFLKECLHLNNHLVVKKNQTVVFSSTHESIYVEFDKSRLMQVVNNLFTNAIKYSEFNKEIMVRVSCSENGQNYLKTEIIDNGLGIEDKYHSRIFDPFTTTSNMPTNNETKTGLGLAISKKIIEMHNGTIDFISEKGKGSNFFFTLPLGKNGG